MKVTVARQRQRVGKLFQLDNDAFTLSIYNK
jgi:hypothetical protein